MTIRHQLNYKFWLHLLLPLLFFLVGNALIYTLDLFEFDPDEGINLMKAFLVNRGYLLYQDIWNDQPPLLTHLLAVSFNVFEPNVNFARSIILILSTLLIWQNWLILYLLGGIDCALIGSLLLIISPDYLKLSISVMVGLPCLCLALGAFLTIIIWHSSHKTIWLAVSAILLSLSVCTKLFTLFLAPIIVTGILLDRAFNPKQTWLKKLQPSMLWIAIFSGLTLLLLALLVGIENIHLLVENHVDAKNITAFEGLSLQDYVQTDYKIFLVGFGSLGVVFACRRRKWEIFYFVAWLVMFYILLQQHRPVWYHQVLTIHIPAIILAACGLGKLTKIVRNRGISYVFKQRAFTIFLSVVMFVSTILLVGEQTKTTIKAIEYWRTSWGANVIPQNLEYQFLAEINQPDFKTNWMVTDSPMFAFRASIPVPPATAVLSRKQLETKNMTDAKVINIINQYQPEQVFLKRFEWSQLNEFLSKNYQLSKQEREFRLYIKDK